MLVLSVVVIKCDLIKALKEVVRMIVAKLDSFLVGVFVAVAGVMASSSPA